MSYQGPKPFGRRRTDRPLPEPERRQLQTIRRDVDEDSSGMIRRYLRLAARALDEETPKPNHVQMDRRNSLLDKKRAA